MQDTTENTDEPPTEDEDDDAPTPPTPNQEEAETLSETPEDADPDGEEEEESLFPVERAADLTKDHLPQQVVDEVQRPLKAKLKRLGQAFADAQDSRNDLINQKTNILRQVDSDLKMVRKDSERFNSVHMEDPLLQEALVDAGVAQEPEQVQAQQPNAGEEDA